MKHYAIRVEDEKAGFVEQLLASISFIEYRELTYGNTNLISDVFSIEKKSNRGRKAKHVGTKNILDAIDKINQIRDGLNKLYN